MKAIAMAIVLVASQNLFALDLSQELEKQNDLYRELVAHLTDDDEALEQIKKQYEREKDFVITLTKLKKK